MNLKRVLMLTLVCSISTALQAELKLVDDSVLAGVSGQAGLTIDIDMGVEIGEFMFKDAGSIVSQGLRIGGMDHSTDVGTKFDKSTGIVYDAADPGNGNTVGFETIYGGTTGLNNARVEVDVAGAGESFGWAWGPLVSPASLLCVGCNYIAGDGDLIIHGTVSDPRLVARSYQSVDFGLELDLFGLKDSTYIQGDDIVDRNGTSTTAQATTIMSDLKMEGYIGGFDMIIENRGNGFTNGIANSKININTFFEITEMEYDFDIVGIRYEKMRIHNLRGDLRMFNIDQNDMGGFTSTSQGFAQSNTHLYAVKDSVVNVATMFAPPTGSNPAGFVDGIAFKTRFVGDMDIGHLSFGDTGTSIGELYYTDMDIHTTMTFSAH